jgi:hypothetical protein
MAASWSSLTNPTRLELCLLCLAQDLGVGVAYLPGLAIRRAADLYPGNAKTDSRDALAPARRSVAVSAACIARLSALAFSCRIARCASVGFAAMVIPP